MILSVKNLQPCDYTSSSYGAAQCYNLSAGCQGSANGNCIPNYFWSSVSQGNYNLNSGNLNGPNTNSTSYPFSARCVRSWKQTKQENKKGNSQSLIAQG